MMKQFLAGATFMAFSAIGWAQSGITPQQLIELNRVSGLGLTEDGQNVLFHVSKVNLSENKKTGKTMMISINGGKVKEVENASEYIKDKHISPDGSKKIVVRDVKVKSVYGTDFYPEMKESNVMIYDELNYRHWDKWEDGAYDHVFIEPTDGRGRAIDIMNGEPFDCPTKPFGGSEDYIWSPNGESVLYVTKKKYGTEYAVSTNTDIYEYNLKTEQTTNLTKGNLGYDTQPAFSSQGQLAWLQMKRDGYESDKNDIIVRIDGAPVNLTKDWDGTVNGFIWADKGQSIFFTAPVNGTTQLFEIGLPQPTRSRSEEGAYSSMQPRQITAGMFDVRGIVGQTGATIVVSRGDMNHASELYTVNRISGEMQQLTYENDKFYNSISLSKIEKRIVKTTDGKDMVTWVIYPPNFDKNKKYPTLLYCQGGPQGALSQFYSYRWNFQLMAAHGYIVVAPNRRGMPGYGVAWNEQISKDYGGQNMKDYLAAIDDVAKEDYVDKNRLGCVGASYGGYSAFYLSAIHEGRFKSFIAHDGIFNWRSMYGTTEELFFVNWDLGGPYWDKKNPTAQRSYTAFNPVEHVEKWSAPIMVIQGGKDFRVPIGQGLEAFQAAKLQGLKSKLLFFPEENHWVLDYQNSLIWHTEFYKWLEETLPATN